MKINPLLPTRALLLGLVATLPALAGCGALVARATDSAAQSLTAAILNQDDPETVRDAAPAYLVLMDSMVQNNPDDAGALASAALLYAAYGATFVSDPERAKRLTRSSAATRLGATTTAHGRATTMTASCRHWPARARATMRCCTHTR